MYGLSHSDGGQITVSLIAEDYAVGSDSLIPVATAGPLP